MFNSVRSATLPALTPDSAKEIDRALPDLSFEGGSREPEPELT